jgi:hypothetical protein
MKHDTFTLWEILISIPTTLSFQRMHPWCKVYVLWRLIMPFYSGVQNSIKELRMSREFVLNAIRIFNLAILSLLPPPDSTGLPFLPGWMPHLKTVISPLQQLSLVSTCLLSIIRLIYHRQLHNKYYLLAQAPHLALLLVVSQPDYHLLLHPPQHLFTSPPKLASLRPGPLEGWFWWELPYFSLLSSSEKDDT